MKIVVLIFVFWPLASFANLVEFHIKSGTALQSRKTADENIEMRLQVSVQFFNDD